VNIEYEVQFKNDPTDDGYVKVTRCKSLGDVIDIETGLMGKQCAEWRRVVAVEDGDERSLTSAECDWLTEIQLERTGDVILEIYNDGDPVEVSLRNGPVDDPERS
jgi:hypothetical protein